MKKLVALLLVCLLCVSVLSACTGTCEMCGEEGRVYTVEYQGEDGKFCKDCKETVEGLIDLAEALS